MSSGSEEDKLADGSPVESDSQAAESDSDSTPTQVGADAPGAPVEGAAASVVDESDAAESVVAESAVVEDDVAGDADEDDDADALEDEDGGEAPQDDQDDDDADEDPEADAEGPATARRRRRRRLRRGAGEKPAGKAKKDDPKSKKALPAPRRRRSTRKPGEPLPVVRAQAKYVRSSARKARLVCDHIRGKSVEDARAILAHTPRAVARDWSKLLESAVANAEHNHELVGEDLYVKVIQADEGPTIKRHRPRAQGRATQIRKRTAHLTILLTPKE